MSDIGNPEANPVTQQPEASSSKGKALSRRNFLKVAGVGAAALATYGATKYLTDPDTQDQMRFFVERGPSKSGEHFEPTDLSDMLPQKYTDKMFDSLGLAEKCPNTLNKDAFHHVAQRVARLANFYFEPNKGDSQKQKEEEFGTFSEQFFKKMEQHCDQMNVDFVSVLLAWQVSGANTSTFRAQADDLRDERIRVGLNLIENFTGADLTQNLVAVMRQFDVAFYYPMARIEGPVTLGIHDIETIMICRGLADLKNSQPEYWQQTASKVLERFPLFAQKYEAYTRSYEQFEKRSDEITKEVNDSEEIRTYLEKFQKEDRLTNLLSENGRVDDYQVLRTTTFWANVCELQAKASVGAYLANSASLEKQALRQSVKQYLDNPSPSAIFFDQIGNPKMIKQLEQDAGGGNKTAKHLLDIAKEFNAMGDKIIDEDRDVAAALVSEKTEQDMEFQLMTGISYARYLLHDAYNHINKGADPKAEIRFNDPNELAYAAFLATANRENGTVHQLAGKRPLHGATLPFLPPKQMFATMDKFVANVYQKFEPQAPEKSFRTYVQYMTTLLEEAYMPSFIGMNRFELNGDEKTGKFIAAAKKEGAFEDIITPPHNSWMRSIEATAGYITKMKA